MAEKKIIEIEVKTQQAVQSMDALSKSTKEAGKEFDKAATFAERYGEELQPLTSRMGEAEDRLYELANAGQTTTQEYKDLLKSVGEFRKVQINTDLAVDAAATTMGQKLGGALGGVTAGFSLAQGAFAAFGKESEEIEKALLKVQAAMAIQQGVQGIREAIPSFKALGTAIKSTTVFQGIYNFVMGISNKETLTNVAITEADTIAKVGLGTATVGVATATTGASTAMKVLRAAIISTGIGALVVGVVLLIQNFDYLKEKFNSLGTGAKVLLSMIMPVVAVFWALSEAYNYFAADSIKANAKAESAIKKNTAALNAQIKANERSSTALKTKNGHEYNMAKASGASTKALRALALKHAEAEIALGKVSLATAKSTYETEKNTLAMYKNNGVSEEFITQQKKLVVDARKNLTKENKDLVDAYKNKKEVIRNNQVEIREEITENNTKIKEANKTHNDKIKQQNEEAAKTELDRIKKLKEDIASLEEEARVAKLTEEDKEVDALNKKYDKIIEDAKKQELDVKKLEENKRLALIAIKDKYDVIDKAKQDEIDKTKKEKLLQEKTFLQEITLEEDELKLAKLTLQYEADQLLYKDNKEILKALDIKYAKDKEDLENEELAKKRERTKKGIDMAMSALSILNDAFQMSAGKSEKDQRKAFKAQKAFNLASAVTNTYLAVTGALTAGGNPIKLATGMQFVEAGIAAATGAVQIAKIAKTQFDSSSFTKDTDDNGGGNAPTMSAPQFNVVGQSGVNQLATLNQQPIQAYVVSGQVTSQQALDRNRLENATLGG
jgi:hypothetical protein